MSGLLKALNAVCIGFTAVMLSLHAWGIYRSYNLGLKAKSNFIMQCSMTLGETPASDQYCSCMIDAIESEGLILGGNYDCIADAKIAAWLSTPGGVLAMHKCMPKKDIFSSTESNPL